MKIPKTVWQNEVSVDDILDKEERRIWDFPKQFTGSRESGIQILSGPWRWEEITFQPGSRILVAFPKCRIQTKAEEREDLCQSLDLERGMLPYLGKHLSQVFCFDLFSAPKSMYRVSRRVGRIRESVGEGLTLEIPWEKKK